VHDDDFPRSRRRFTLGLRLQIVLALGAVIVIAYVPLFFAIAQVARATSLAERDRAASSLAHAIATHVRDLPLDDTLARRLDAELDSGAVAIAVYTQDGSLKAAAGAPSETDSLRPSKNGALAHTTAHNQKRAVDVTVQTSSHAAVVRVVTDIENGRSIDLFRGIALYMGIFALALLVFAYSLLTRAIVKPIEALARAADRVANGARSLDINTPAAREIHDLGLSVRSMTARLLDDEKRLRAKVEELTTTTKRLSETREQLAGSERMASVGRLAAGVAHEIGNPIAAIMGMHDLIEDGEIPAETKEDFLRRMRKETERIHVVVRDLLDYARPEQELPNGQVSTALVQEVIDDALALVRPQKDWKDITLHVDIEEGLRARLSPQRLTQVVLNLLLNAAAAMGTGGRLAVRAKTMTAGRMHIAIEDDGPGVPEAVRVRIFDPFVTTKDVGTGLGLSVCRGIVEAAKGRIYLDASYTDGARFVVELPSEEGAT
jgi:signal transduction histidine kinase